MGDIKDIEMEPAQTEDTENVGITEVDTNEGNVTDWFQVDCEGTVAVALTTDTGLGTRSLVKCKPVVMKTLNSWDNESRAVSFNSLLFPEGSGSVKKNRPQSTSYSLKATQAAASELLRSHIRWTNFIRSCSGDP